MSSKENVMVFSEMRPPVAALKGSSPLRDKKAKKLTELSEADYMAMNITKKNIVESMTD